MLRDRGGVVLQPQRTKQYAYRLDVIDTAAAVAVVGRFLPMEMSAEIIAPERSPQGAFFRRSVVTILIGKFSLCSNA